MEFDQAALSCSRSSFLLQDICAQDEALMLVQSHIGIRKHNVTHEVNDTEAANVLSVKEAGEVVPISPFRQAFILSIDRQRFSAAHERLEHQGVSSEPVWGFNANSPPELTAALQLLKEYNNTDHIHGTVTNWEACMHMAPGTPPHVMAALSEFASGLLEHTPRNVDELLGRDRHNCVPKMVAIAASHVRLWKDLAEGRLPTGASWREDAARIVAATNATSLEGAASADGEAGDPWYLVMEDDSALCPGWRQRMLQELPEAPVDADIIKLFFFGHWRAEDEVIVDPGNPNSPFLEAKDPLKMFDIFKASSYELLHGATWKTVPTAGFYAGTQAYLLRRSGAKKLLAQIRGKPFQDVDMTMLGSVKHYVWRKVLVMNAEDDARAGGGGGDGLSLMQIVPMCNLEPPKDWWFR